MSNGKNRRQEARHDEVENDAVKQALEKAAQERLEARLKNGNGGGANGSAKQEVPAPEPATPVPEEQPNKSWLDQMRAKAAVGGAVEEIRKDLQESEEGESSLEVVSMFVRTVRGMDDLALHRLGADKSANQARSQWFGLTWDEREAQIAKWAQAGDESARRLLSDLQVCSGNTFFRDDMRQAVDLFERPARYAENLDALQDILEGHNNPRKPEEGLVKKVFAPNRVPQDGIVFVVPGNKVLFVPNRTIRVARLAWPFVKEVFDQLCKEQVEHEQEALDERSDAEKLADEATQGLTPLKVTQGRQGNLFLYIGRGEAVLIECAKRGGFMQTVVTKAVGLDLNLPAEPVLWDGRYNPSQGGKWCDSRIPRVLKTWEDKCAQWQKKYVTEREELLKPITSVGTIPSDPREQGLTRLAKGEDGVLPLWNMRFQWGRDNNAREGIFGIALERRGEEFILRAVVSPEHEFDKKLVGEKLPLVASVNGKTSIGLPRFEGKVDHFNSLKMVEILLRLRLGLEEKVGVRAPRKEEASVNAGK